MRFDPQKLADLVDEESRLKHTLAEVSTNLADLKATDKTWDDARVSRPTSWTNRSINS